MRQSLFIRVFLVMIMVAGILNATWIDEYGQLSVQGSDIVSESGDPAVLRGMSLYWSCWGGEAYYNAETVGHLASDWKVNVVRAAMAVDVTNDYDGGIDGYITNSQQQKGFVTTVVDAAIANGIYVVIDFHSHNANNYTSQAQTFFSEMAQQYGDHPNVIYEIFNEPTDVGWSTIKNYANQVISSIRQHDSDNLIVVGTPHYSQFVDDAANDPISGTNIAYTLHFYAGSHDFNATADGDWSPVAVRAKGAVNSIPMFVTEFGTCNADGDGSYDYSSAEAWLDWCDQNGISYCKWSVHNLGESSAILNSGVGSLSGWSTSDLKGSGDWMRSRCRDLNGDPTEGDPDPVDTLDIPGKIEAENYTDMAGIDTEECSDQGGGQNIGYLDNGDWVSYLVNVAQSGHYDIDLRMASESSGNTADISVDGGSLTSAEIPNTGGYQTWETVTVSGYLNAGVHTLRIDFTGGDGLGNLNWLDVQEGTSVRISERSGTGLSIRKPGLSGSELCFNLRSSEQVVGIRLYTLSGELVRSLTAMGEKGRNRIDISAQRLSGNVFVCSIETSNNVNWRGLVKNR